jgi:hypothetical protein
MHPVLPKYSVPFVQVHVLARVHAKDFVLYR